MRLYERALIGLVMAVVVIFAWEWLESPEWEECFLWLVVLCCLVPDYLVSGETFLDYVLTRGRGA